jgi:hypothetical protein
MNPYYGTTDDGTDLYGSPGAFTDENGVALSISAGTSLTLASGAAATIPSPAGASPSSPTSSNNSWISGLGSLFGSIGTTLTNVTRATKSPTINPATGVPYGINPATGQPVVSTAGQTSLLLIVLVAVIAWAVIGGRAPRV